MCFISGILPFFASFDLFWSSRNNHQNPAAAYACAEVNKVVLISLKKLPSYQSVQVAQD